MIMSHNHPSSNHEGTITTTRDTHEIGGHLTDPLQQLIIVIIGPVWGGLLPGVWGGSLLPRPIPSALLLDLLPLTLCAHA